MFKFFLNSFSVLLFIIHAPLISIPTCNFYFDQSSAIQQNHHNPNLFHADQYKHAHGSYDTAHILSTFSATDLKNYFTYHHYSEKDILACDALYMSDEFVNLAKTFAGYHLAIKKLYHKLNSTGKIGRLIRMCSGEYCRGLFKRIEYLYNQIQYAKQFLSTDAELFANSYDINLIELCPYNESLAAQHMYQRYIHILNKASLIPKHNSIARDCIGQASHIGLEANNHGHIQQASQLADFCSTAIDLTTAFGEGIYLGVINSVDAIIHPIQTIKNGIVGIGAIAYGLTKLTAMTGECLFLYATDNNRYFIRQQEIITYIDKIIENTEKKLRATPMRELVKQRFCIYYRSCFMRKNMFFCS